ncbi:MULTISPECIES: hypothetical protein [unclassified Streptococcus]|nr:MULTISPECIES: hypothetical protein [unclassified Streptococcus]
MMLEDCFELFLNVLPMISCIVVAQLVVKAKNKHAKEKERKK